MRRGHLRSLAALLLVLGVSFATEPQACRHGGRHHHRHHHATLQAPAPSSDTPRAGSQPGFRGPRLLGAYCTQCHGLPDPAQHTPQEWEAVAKRMYRRMVSLAPRVQAPSHGELGIIVAYLQGNSEGPGVNP